MREVVGFRQFPRGQWLSNYPVLYESGSETDRREVKAGGRSEAVEVIPHCRATYCRDAAPKTRSFSRALSSRVRTVLSCSEATSPAVGGHSCGFHDVALFFCLQRYLFSRTGCTRNIPIHFPMRPFPSCPWPQHILQREAPLHPPTRCSSPKSGRWQRPLHAPRAADSCSSLRRASKAGTLKRRWLEGLLAHM